MKTKVRVRFAPSPTGNLHLGNIRTALLNYLFAKKQGGTFVLRIEDTDQGRNINNAYQAILDDLAWLGITYQEGPIKGGPYAPYLQSDRTNLYQQQLEDLIDSQRVYRCFCTPEHLAQRRVEQLAAKLPPRYDRTCINFSDDMILAKIKAGIPFAWRLKLNHDQVIEIKTMERGTVSFELVNFSDPVLARSDGSFMFTFANFIDDWLMEVTHVIRGEDHLSNTAIQGAMFDAFMVKLPIFWHLPFLCDLSGHKLSKRDFGFALKDLKDAGFLPQAICNYLVLAGSTLQEEIQSLSELVASISFDHLHSTGPIKYDYDKLRWINHKWINRLDEAELVDRVRPFLCEEYDRARTLSTEVLKQLIHSVKADCHTLKEFVSNLEFYFRVPEPKRIVLEEAFGKEQTDDALRLIMGAVELVGKGDLFFERLKSESKEKGIKPKALWGALRYLLTGALSGMGAHELCDILGEAEVKRRLTKPL